MHPLAIFDDVTAFGCKYIIYWLILVDHCMFNMADEEEQYLCQSHVASTDGMMEAFIGLGLASLQSRYRNLRLHYALLALVPHHAE